MRYFIQRYKRKIVSVVFVLIAIIAYGLYNDGYSGLLDLKPDEELKVNIYHYDRELGSMCWSDDVVLERTITSYDEWTELKENCSIDMDYNKSFFDSNYLYFSISAYMYKFQKTYYYSANTNAVYYRTGNEDVMIENGYTRFDIVTIPRTYILPSDLEVEYKPDSSD